MTGKDLTGNSCSSLTATSSPDYLSVGLPVCLRVCPSVCPPVCARGSRGRITRNIRMTGKDLTGNSCSSLTATSSPDYLSVGLPVCLRVCPSVCPPVCARGSRGRITRNIRMTGKDLAGNSCSSLTATSSPDYLSVCRSACVSACLSVCPSACLCEGKQRAYN